MSYKDPQDRRRYDRERRRRAREAKLAAARSIPVPVRLRTAADAQSLLEEAVGLVRSDAKARSTDKAKALVQIAGVLMRLIETRDLTDRLEAVERVIKLRDTSAA